MTLAECLELGKECGLSTVQECVLNVEIHATSLFSYDKMNDELQELYCDLEKEEQKIFNKYYKKGSDK